MQNKLTLYEYDEFLLKEKYIRKDNSRKYENFIFNNSDSFIKFLEKHELDGKSFLEIKGIYSIKASNFVGMINYKGMQIEVLPKLLKYDDKDKEGNETILSNLIYMLSYTKKLNIKTSSANLHKNPNNFIEILIYEYSWCLLNALNREIPRHYANIEENCNFLKGKLLFNENLKCNISNQAKFYCQYDEFNANILLNHLFYYVSYMLLKLTKDNRNKKMLTIILNCYTDIEFQKVNYKQIQNLKLKPNQEIFKTSFIIAKMFLENSSIDFSTNKIENISLIWDMNKLFEEFICEFIRKNKGKINSNIENIFYQKSAKIFDDVSKPYYNSSCKTDIYLKMSDGKNIIIDTKYKELENYKAPFENIYQIYFYGRNKELNSKDLILLYVGKRENKKFVINDVNNNTNLEIAFIDLEIDLKNESKELIENLKEIFKKLLD